MQKIDLSNQVKGALSSLSLKNVAGTFINAFTNATTAARTWTMQDKDYTVAGLDDIAANVRIKQKVSFYTGAMATGTTTIPLDDTIPQQATDGTQFMSLSITPTNASSVLIVTAKIDLANSAGVVQIAALFRDSGADAIATTWESVSAGQATSLLIRVEVSAGSTSTTTFKIKSGGHAAGTTTFNGSASARFFGGTMNSYIEIEERLP